MVPLRRNENLPIVVIGSSYVWGREALAVIERWLFNGDANLGHYITSDLSKWLLQ